jgi:hypothetical protein
MYEARNASIKGTDQYKTLQKNLKEIDSQAKVIALLTSLNTTA